MPGCALPALRRRPGESLRGEAGPGERVPPSWRSLSSDGSLNFARGRPWGRLEGEGRLSLPAASARRFAPFRRRPLVPSRVERGVGVRRASARVGRGGRYPARPLSRAPWGVTPPRCYHVIVSSSLKLPHWLPTASGCWRGLPPRQRVFWATVLAGSSERLLRVPLHRQSPARVSGGQISSGAGTPVCVCVCVSGFFPKCTALLASWRGNVYAVIFT